MKTGQRIQLAVENCFTSVWVKMFLFLKWEGCLAEKCVFHQMCWKNTTRCWKLCFTSVSVKIVLFSKWEGYLGKKRVLHQICSKIQLAFKNCVGLHFGLKTTFCRIISMSSYKMRFTWNLLKEYNSMLKTLLDFILC